MARRRKGVIGLPLGLPEPPEDEEPRRPRRAKASPPPWQPLNEAAGGAKMVIQAIRLARGLGYDPDVARAFYEVYARVYWA